MAMYTKEQKKEYGKQFSEKERSSYSTGRSAAIKDLVRLARGNYAGVTDNSLKAVFKAIVLAAYNEGVKGLNRRGGLKGFSNPLDQERQGEPIVEVKYFDNGNKKEETTFVNGVKNGEYKLWYSNGKLARTGYYKDGLMDGEWREYDDYYGNLIDLARYKNDKLHGRATSWDKCGFRFDDKLYVNGIEVKNMLDNDADDWLYEHQELFE